MLLPVLLLSDDMHANEMCGLDRRHDTSTIDLASVQVLHVRLQFSWLDLTITFKNMMNLAIRSSDKVHLV